MGWGEREMFYLTTHSTHFIYGYMASDIWLRTHEVDPMSYFSFQPVLHCRGMCYPFCGMMHIKEPLLLIGKSSPF